MKNLQYIVVVFCALLLGVVPIAAIDNDDNKLMQVFDKPEVSVKSLIRDEKKELTKIVIEAEKEVKEEDAEKLEQSNNSANVASTKFRARRKRADQNDSDQDIVSLQGNIGAIKRLYSGEYRDVDIARLLVLAGRALLKGYQWLSV
jgi:hypothetical protein